MFLFSDNSVFYRRIGLGLMLAQFWLFIFALPPFEVGEWMQTEPVMVAMFVSATLNALWLLWGVWRGRLVAQPLSPVFKCLLLFVGWQLVVTLLSSNPWHTWFGPVEMGEGTGWHVILLLQYMVLYPLWMDTSSRRLLLVGAISSLIPQCALHFLFQQDVELPDGVEGWAPGAWAAYLAFMVVPLWMGLIVSGIIKSPRSYIAPMLLLFGVLLISHNKSSQVLFPLALLVSFLANLLPRFFIPGKHWRVTMALVAVAASLFWIGFSSIYPAFPDTSHSGAITKLLAEKDGAMSTRLVFNKVGMIAIEHSPSRWIIGDGWGHFRDDLFKYVLVDGVKVYEGKERDPNWFMVNGYAFHSHNQPLEALLSLGLIGMILWFAIPVAALMTMEDQFFWGCAPLLVAQTILCSIWFELPQCIPYLALMWVIPSPLGGGSGWGHGSAESNNAPLPASPLMGEGILKTALTLAVLAMAGSAVGQWEGMWYGENMYQANHNPEKRVYDRAWVERDIAHGGERLRELATAYSSILEKQSSVDKNDADWFAQYQAALHDAGMSPYVGAQIASAEVELDYDALDLHQKLSSPLPDALIRLAAKAPLRDDIATRYLLTFDSPVILGREASRESRQVQIQFLQQLLAINPNHRGALWKLGAILRKTPGREAEGIAMQKRALELGVGSVYPVGEKDMAELKQPEKYFSEKPGLFAPVMAASGSSLRH